MAMPTNFSSADKSSALPAGIFSPQTHPVSSITSNIKADPNTETIKLERSTEQDDLKNRVRGLTTMLLIRADEMNDIKKKIKEIRNAFGHDNAQLNEILRDTDEEYEEVVPAKYRLGSPLDMTPTMEEQLRNTQGINLQVTVHVSGNMPKAALDFTIPATICTDLTRFRKQLALASAGGKLQQATSWADHVMLRMLRDFKRVTMKFTEDGHMASMTRSPTVLDGACVFPEMLYEAWYYRNILRGKEDLYCVNVKINV